MPPSMTLTVDVDHAGTVTVSGGDTAYGDITVTKRNTTLQFRFGPGTTGYRFQQFLVTTGAMACPPQEPYPPLPHDNEFSVPHLPQPHVLTVVDRCSSETTYNYALGVQPAGGGRTLWLDPQIVNRPG